MTLICPNARACMGEHARKQIEQFDVYEFSCGDRTDQ